MKVDKKTAKSPIFIGVIVTFIVSAILSICSISGIILIDRNSRVTDGLAEIQFIDQNGRNISSILKVEVADTPSSREIGLMYRHSLDNIDGMIFVFDKPTIPSFWMKNTLIELYMIFVGEDMVIKYVVDSATPNNTEIFYSPPEEVLYVVELKGGEASRMSIETGASMRVISEV